MTVSYNFAGDSAVAQGADWFFTIIYKQPDGTPVDLTGYTAAMQLRSFPNSPTAVLTLTTASGITIDGLTGTVNVHATNQETGAIDEGNYYYDLEVTDPVSGIITRLIQGIAEVSAEITHV